MVIDTFDECVRLFIPTDELKQKTISFKFGTFECKHCVIFVFFQQMFERDAWFSNTNEQQEGGHGDLLSLSSAPERAQ